MTTSVSAGLKLGSNVVVRTPGLILSGKVIKIGIDNWIKVQLENPYGVPFPFTAWMVVTHIEKE